jgi:hypothetical protein
MVVMIANAWEAIFGSWFAGTNLVTITGFFMLVIGFFSIFYFVSKIFGVLKKIDYPIVRNSISSKKRELVNITLQLLASHSHDKKLLESILDSIDDNDIETLDSYDFEGVEQDE